MLDIVLTLVFSVVMLIFMVFHAMKIVEWIESKADIDSKWHIAMLFATVVMLSLMIGLFLKFA